MTAPSQEHTRVFSLPAHFCRGDVGRYALYGEIASGGMAAVHFGRLRGPAGFGRTVAIKRLHPQFASDPEFVGMLRDEARLVARIQHPNVVQTIDMVSREDELFLVMEYVQGISLLRLLREAGKVEGSVHPAICASLVQGMLEGLHAAHEARGEDGLPLEIIHRDVSPENVLVGPEGLARLVDFGVAKAALRLQATQGNQLKGKLGYLAPEQVTASACDRRVDVYAASVVLWELLTGRRYISRDNPAVMLREVVSRPPIPPSRIAPHVRAELDAIVVRGLSADPEARFATAREMALALERRVQIASAREVGAWVERVGGEMLAQRAETVAAIDRAESRASLPSAPTIPTVPGLSVTSDSLRPIVSGSATRRSRPPPPARWPVAVSAGLLAASVLALAGASVYAVAGQRPEVRRATVVAIDRAAAHLAR